jgi:hypothetical protein
MKEEYRSWPALWSKLALSLVAVRSVLAQLEEEENRSEQIIVDLKWALRQAEGLESAAANEERFQDFNFTSSIFIKAQEIFCSRRALKRMGLKSAIDLLTCVQDSGYGDLTIIDQVDKRLKKHLDKVLSESE